jgi:hypothetical protein
MVNTNMHTNVNKISQKSEHMWQEFFFMFCIFRDILLEYHIYLHISASSDYLDYVAYVQFKKKQINK